MSETITDHELQELKKMSVPQIEGQTHRIFSLENITRIVNTIESQKEEIEDIKRHQGEYIASLEFEINSLKAITELKNAEIEALKLFYNMQGEEAQTMHKEYLRYQTNAGRTINQLMDLGKANDRTNEVKKDLAKQIAITNITVKALEKISDFCKDSFALNTSSKALSEIEGIKNATS